MKVLRSLAIFVMATGLAGSLMAQAITGSVGNIYGGVTDEQGGALPGVAVTLSGMGAPRSTVSGPQGEFRFLQLSAGNYMIRTELAGFATMERTNIIVQIGTNTEVKIPMKIAAVATTITVTEQTPLLDVRKERSGTNFSNEELKEIPSSRDPWGVLQQTAGVLLDQVQTGSQASGQQSVFIGKGTNFTGNAWNVDGVSFTDLAATGASPTYWDFDSFQEMQMTTGGSDPSIGVPGVTLNLVTKRGTNEPHGSARVNDSPKETEAKARIPQEALDQGLTSVNHINNIQDYGLEVGGPAIPDKFWLWGSFGHTDIKLITAGGTFDNTQLENYAAKGNIQPIESNSATIFYFRGNKTKQGRNASPRRPQATTWDQSGPSHIWKGDDSQVFGPNFVANVVWDFANTPFNLDPEGGTATNIYRDASRVWHNSFYVDHNSRPQHAGQATASAFFNTGSIGHELKFGVGVIRYMQQHVRFYPGDETYGDKIHTSNNDPNYPFAAFVSRGDVDGQELTGIGGFIGDTLTMSNLTVNLGLRYDTGYGRNLASNVAANTAFPDLVPGLNYAGSGAPFRTKDWQPRVGLTYALGPQKSTLLRASYARFVDQGGTSGVAFENPLGAISGLKYQWSDANGDNIVQRDELCIAGTPGTTCGAPSPFGGFDPTNPSNATSSTNVIDPKLKSPKTDEFMVGIDQQILPELVAGVNGTYRRRFDTVWNCPLALDNSHQCISNSDYSLFSTGVPGTDIAGRSVGNSGPIYSVTALTEFLNDGTSNPLFDPAIAGAYTYGSFETNRPDFENHYTSLEFNLTKRLSNRWMAHATFTLANWKTKVKNVAKGCIDPTNQVGSFQGYFEGAQGHGDSCSNNIAYDYYGFAYLNSKWAFNVSGLYQLPLNFNISAQLFGRQGYPVPYWASVDPGDGLGSRTVAVGKPDAHRMSAISELDLRIEKVIPLFQKADVTLAIDIFNVFNRNTVTIREQDAGSGLAGAIDQIQVPRVLRFGARVSF